MADSSSRFVRVFVRTRPTANFSKETIKIGEDLKVIHHYILGLNDLLKALLDNKRQAGPRLSGVCDKQ